MAAAGAISDQVRDVIPWTWDALKKPGQGLGEDALQRRIDSVKRRLFGTSTGYKDEDDESDYDLVVQEYIGKLVALQLINPGIEFWMNASTSVTTQGHASAETAEYPDRVKALQDLRERLLVEVAVLGEELVDVLADLGTVVRTKRPSSPRVNTSSDDEIAPDPQTWYPGDGSNRRPAHVLIRSWTS